MKLKRSEIKALMLESVLETLNNKDSEQAPSRDFLVGQRWALADKQKGVEHRDISQQSKDFKKGYYSVMGGWWQRFNDKMTQLMGQIGLSNSK